MKIWLADPGPTRWGRALRGALQAHEVMPLEPELPLQEAAVLLPPGWQPELLLFTPAQLGRLPVDLDRAPAPTLLVFPRREAFRLRAGTPFDVVREGPAGYDPGLHHPEPEPLWERDLGHPGPPPEDLRPLARAAGWAERVAFLAGLDPAAAARFLARTRITVSTGEDPELDVQASACGSLVLPAAKGRKIRALLANEEARLHLAREQRHQILACTWQREWDKILSQRPERNRRVPPLWWPAQIYQSQARTRLEQACRRVTGRGFPARNLLGCLLATRADYEPDVDVQTRLRLQARECFEQARPLGSLALLNQAQLLLRAHELEEAVTVLCEAVLDGVKFCELDFYPLVRNQFFRRWQAAPARREALVRGKIWQLLAEHCPPFGLKMARLAVRAEPELPESWWQLALRLGSRPGRQARALRALLRRDPMHADARLGLIRLMWENGQKRSACQLMKDSRDMLAAFPYLEREPRDLERLWVRITSCAEARDPR